jgi:hypothetical protein
MKVDFSKGVSIRIAGELGKYNTLPIEALVKIMQNWQWLLQVIAKTHITGEAGIDLNNFKIELSDFTKGSAVPQVQFTKRVNNELFGKIDKQRNIVSDVFENFAKIADKGDYPTLKNMYPSPATRNEIVEALYGFRDSLGESPVAIVETNDNSFETIYTFKKFLPETKKDLITIITNDVNPEFSEKIVLATVKQTTKNSGKTKNKVLQTYLQDNLSLSYAPKNDNHCRKNLLFRYTFILFI